MSPWTQAALVGVLLLNLSLAAAGGIRVLIRAFAVQAALASVLVLLVDGLDSPHGWAVALCSLLLKGWAIPFFLGRAAARTGTRKATLSHLSPGASLLAAAFGVALAFGLAARLPFEARRTGLLLTAAAFSTMFTGLLLLVGRNQALSQVVGYLVLENGIFLFGLTLLRRMPFVVEMGILLDVFVGVFVMGIVAYNIHRTFDSLDVEALTGLREEP